MISFLKAYYIISKAGFEIPFKHIMLHLSLTSFLLKGVPGQEAAIVQITLQPALSLYLLCYFISLSNFYL